MERQNDIYSRFSDISNYFEKSESRLDMSKIKIFDIHNLISAINYRYLLNKYNFWYYKFELLISLNH